MNMFLPKLLLFVTFTTSAVNAFTLSSNNGARVNTLLKVSVKRELELEKLGIISLSSDDVICHNIILLVVSATIFMCCGFCFMEVIENFSFIPSCFCNLKNATYMSSCFITTITITILITNK